MFSVKQEETTGHAPDMSGREKLLTDQPELLQQFGMDLLPVLIQIYGSSVNAPVRHKCLSAIGKLFYFCSADMIRSLLGATNISSFLAGVLAWKDPQVLLPSLEIANILMETLPETSSKLFVREGVVHAVDTLIISESSEKDDTWIIHTLKNLCSKLIALTDDHKSKYKGKSKASSPRVVDFSPATEDNLLKVVTEMLAEVSKGDGVSTFEFIGSGVADALLNYLSCGCFLKKRVSEDNLLKLCQKSLKRYRSFIAVALPYGPGESNLASMSVLVQKLQNALTSLECFPVVLSHSSRSCTGGSRLSSGLGVLSRPFKLRLCRAHGEKSLCDYSSNILLIDPLASLSAVEDFLWPRVQRSESSHKSSTSVRNSESTPAPATCRQSTRSRSGINIGNSNQKGTIQEEAASSSKGKGKAVLKPTQDEGKGPRTRNAS